MYILNTIIDNIVTLNLTEWHCQCSKIIGIKQARLSDSFKRFVLRKARAIFSDSTYPLFSEFKVLTSGLYYSMPRLKSDRYKHSCIPTAVRLLNW